MRYQTYGFSISFLAHGVGIFLLLTFCRFVPPETKTLLIDFTTFSVPKPVAAPAHTAHPARPQTTTPPQEKKIVQERPPAPVARIEPTKRKSKVLQPKPESAPAILPPEPEPLPDVAEVVAEPEPAPALLANREETKATQIMGRGSLAAGAELATGGPQSGVMGKQEYIKAHFIYIKDDIQKNITYPHLARKMGWEGKVVVSFVICEDGTVINIRIVKSSGYTLLDKNAIESIKKSMPFPSPPVRAELVVPVSYRLS